MKAIYKVPNGKLLKIFLEKDNNNVIQRVKITGDFFIYPEENVEALEQYLISTTWDKGALTRRIENFLQEKPTELFGLDVESLVSTMLVAA